MLKYLFFSILLVSCSRQTYYFSKVEKYDMNVNEITFKYSVCTPNIKIKVFKDSIEIDDTKYKILHKRFKNDHLRLELEDTKSMNFNFNTDQYYFYSGQSFYKFTK